MKIRQGFDDDDDDDDDDDCNALFDIRIELKAEVVKILHSAKPSMLLSSL